MRATSLPSELDERGREVLRQIVETYIQTGEASGSRSLSMLLPFDLSAATIRNTMADLEALGLIYAPHTSAGRLPTDRGLRFFVDAMLDIQPMPMDTRGSIEQSVRQASQQGGVDAMLQEASSIIAHLTRGAGLVMTPRQDLLIRQVEFVRLGGDQVLFVLVGDNGKVDNRVLHLGQPVGDNVLDEAARLVNQHLRGLTLEGARERLTTMRQAHQDAVDVLSSELIEKGLASWLTNREGRQHLIVKGQAHLLADVKVEGDVRRLQQLFDDLERETAVMDLLSKAELSEGVRLFIGSENPLFSLSGSSVVAAPFRDGEQNIIGVLGVVGPTRLNYAHVVPVVDYTARLMSHLVAQATS